MRRNCFHLARGFSGSSFCTTGSVWQAEFPVIGMQETMDWPADFGTGLPDRFHHAFQPLAGRFIRGCFRFRGDYCRIEFHLGRKHVCFSALVVLLPTMFPGSQSYTFIYYRNSSIATVPFHPPIQKKEARQQAKKSLIVHCSMLNIRYPAAKPDVGVEPTLNQGRSNSSLRHLPSSFPNIVSAFFPELTLQRPAATARHRLAQLLFFAEKQKNLPLPSSHLLQNLHAYPIFRTVHSTFHFFLHPARPSPQIPTVNARETSHSSGMKTANRSFTTPAATLLPRQVARH